MKDEPDEIEIRRLTIGELFALRAYALDMENLSVELKLPPKRARPDLWINVLSICDDELRRRAEILIKNYHQNNKRKPKARSAATKGD